MIAAILDAHKQYKVKKVACGGGVIANRYLRARLKMSEAKDLKFLIPPIEYTADNAAIVAGLGFYLYNKKGMKSAINLEAEAS